MTDEPHDPDDEVIKTLLQLDPKQGDVLVLQLDRHYPMDRLWDRLEHFREIAGIQILTVTDDMTIYPINENSHYVLMDGIGLSDEHQARLIADWSSKFPNSKLAIVPGQLHEVGYVESTGKIDDFSSGPEDGVDIL